MGPFSSDDASAYGPPSDDNSATSGELPWMAVAKSQLGVKEKTGNNDGPEVEKYLRAGGLGTGYSWCGAFVYWVMKTSNVEVDMLSINNNPNWALNWRCYGITLGRPAYGAIATKIRNGGGHIGFVAGETPTGRLVILGGNQSDQVNYTVYPANLFHFNFPFGYTHNYTLPILNIQYGKIKEN